MLSSSRVHVCIECLASAFSSHPLKAYANLNEYKAQPVLVLEKKKIDTTKPQNVIRIQ